MISKVLFIKTASRLW